ncbi:N-acetylmuramoyl-L-alanine amidase [Roseimicrobium gellanilyticum]|uniref:N-acetylmuramoyl-L-alanine amidase n=2 Tax=Roseimicrobium gellanilyticum TaxID=748857 RepID=A0A366H9Y9_9BACT|nr:N-acetylmuramoyl-L-alanine amidase [Roseimicrobium gellanilyticum]
MLLLCSSAGGLAVGAETTTKKKASEEEESGKKSTKGGSKTTTTPSSSGGTKSTPEKTEKTAPATTTKSGSKSSKGSSSSSNTAANTAKKEESKPKTEPAPAPKPKIIAKVDPPKEEPKTKESEKSKDKESTSKTADKTVKPESKTEPAKPAEPRDVTSTSKATSREMDPKEKPDSEFGHETEADKKARSEAAKGSKTAAAVTTSSDISGWEILHYQGADYVTANSIHRFYRFHNLEADGNRVSFTSPVLIMRATIGSQDLLINNIKFVMNDPVLELNGKPCFSRLDLCKLIDPVLRPSYINTSSGFDTVVIDPGHGGHDSGARGIYGYEKDFALKLAFALKSQLEAQGIRVVMTRTTDTFISLGGRVQFANKVPNSIYVSLHFNSGPSTGTGIETFALTPQGASSVYGSRTVDAYSFNGNQRDSENIALATAIHASVVNHFKLVDRGVKRARWYVLKGLERPGVLFEGGFVTSPVDGRLIAADNFRREMAATLCQAIMNYKRALRPSGVRPMGSR